MLSDDEVRQVVQDLDDNRPPGSWEWWLSRLTLMLGLRGMEFARMRTDDLFLRRGRWWLRVPNEGSSTWAGRRRREIPVSRTLEAMGFVDLFRGPDGEMSKESRRLFPTLCLSRDQCSTISGRVQTWRRYRWMGRRPAPLLSDLVMVFALEMHRAEESMWFFHRILGKAPRFPENLVKPDDPLMWDAMVRAVDQARFPLPKESA